MEPMTLGSPTGSPISSPSPYLPPLLLGEPKVSLLQRSNALSPNNTKSVNFGTPSTRQPLQDKFNFESRVKYSHQELTPKRNLEETNHSINFSGPPTQGLFDLLQSEKNKIELSKYSNKLDAVGRLDNVRMNNTGSQSLNDSNLNPYPYSFSKSRITSPANCDTTAEFASPENSLIYTSLDNSDFWITVFGFPPGATSSIISHFLHCGTITEKVFPTQQGNWMHLRFSSQLECEKALNYNEKVLTNNVMIGVTRCKDKSIIEKSNVQQEKKFCQPTTSSAEANCGNVQYPSPISVNTQNPQRGDGIVNKTMNYLFGW